MGIDVFCTVKCNFIESALMFFVQYLFVLMTQMLLANCFLTSNAQMLWCRGILFNFQFWDGKQNFVPNMWQVVFAHISVESRVVDSNVNGLLDCSGNAMSLSSNDLKFSTDVLWPVMLSCSYIGDGAFKCSLNLSSKVLEDSPMYSSSHSVLPHLYQYIILLCFFISSLSFGNINKFFNVFSP